MNIAFINPSARDRVFYTHLFARIVRERRVELNLSTERAAELAGITTSQWDALEDGYVPRDHKDIRVIAEALEIRTSDLGFASLLSSLAQESEL